MINACATGSLDQLRILIPQYHHKPAPTLPTPEYLLSVAAKNGQAQAIRVVFDSLPKYSERPRYPWDPDFPPGVFLAQIPEKWTVYEFMVIFSALEGSDPLAVFKLFFEYGMKADHNLERAINPTACAIANGDLELVKFFLSKGANPNGRYIQPEDTYLGAAASLPQLDMLRLLIEHGSKLEGSQALRQAVQNGRIDNAKLLLSQGVDVNEVYTRFDYIEDKEQAWGYALHWAIIRTPKCWRQAWQKPASKADTVDFLLSRGANPKLLDGEGETPLQLAVAADEGEVIEVFREYGVEK